ncbi:SHOCT domain-containing protein [Pirellulales bacterium]|nr:SHOCT domain-containing protein [Pirellulales bacterium]
MWEFEKSMWGLAKAALWFAVIFALIALALEVVRRLRGRNARDMHGASDALSNFRELHARGGISDEEFRTIKTKLASKLKRESGDNGGTG